MITLTVSTTALSDHLSRLYLVEGPTPHSHRHVDMPGAFIDVHHWGKTTASVELTEAAVRDLLDDADYQAEFTEDPAERAMWKRLIKTVSKTTKGSK